MPWLLFVSGCYELAWNRDVLYPTSAFSQCRHASLQVRHVLYANIKRALRMQIGPDIEVIGAERMDIASMSSHPAWFPTADEADQCSASQPFSFRATNISVASIHVTIFLAWGHK
ncbi:hypothetical protein HAV22_25860 [Massilia sp. TW-1]|uniref:Uncharacterized protein n=1 Tax=Telluria antibiotica TaxID=2717319 RepID=A0ABX0PHX9_9BURK|nr:hypothetical protein [Telluria antibiotica]NIA57052.1 hypothetical protein [Telluria antibiotica]